MKMMLKRKWDLAKDGFATFWLRRDYRTSWITQRNRWFNNAIKTKLLVIPNAGVRAVMQWRVDPFECMLMWLFCIVHVSTNLPQSPLVSRTLSWLSRSFFQYSLSASPANPLNTKSALVSSLKITANTTFLSSQTWPSWHALFTPCSMTSEPSYSSSTSKRVYKQHI